jgi:hypothetical protein
MKAKSAAVIREIVVDLEPFALITENSIHLMLKIIVMDFCIRDLFQKNGASVRICGGLPDIEE